MPAPIDLTGARLGRLTVLALGGPGTGRDAKCWRVRCDCGREETYPQRRLTQGTAAKPAVRACSQCDAPRCAVCEVSLGTRTSRRVCDACRPVHQRSIYRTHYHRVVADPHKRAALLERRRQQRWADPESAREIDRRRYELVRQRDVADPQRVERRLRMQRERYAQAAADIQAKRAQSLESMTDEQFAEWSARARAYQLAYAQRRRQALRADPDAHRAYLETQAEHRRRRSLAAFSAEARALTLENTDAL